MKRVTTLRAAMATFVFRFFFDDLVSQDRQEWEGRKVKLLEEELGRIRVSVAVVSELHKAWEKEEPKEEVYSGHLKKLNDKEAKGSDIQWACSNL